MWALRRIVASNVYQEVTTSLQVSRDREHYSVRWSRQGQSFEKIFPRTDYSFYKRGDRAASKGVEGDTERRNIEQARRFVLETLGLDAGMEVFEPRPTGMPAQEKMAFAWHFVLCAGLLLSDVQGMSGFALVLLAASLLEYIPRWGRLFTAVALFGFVIAGFPLSGLVAGGGYALFQFLDPDPTVRYLRVAVSAAAAMYGVSQIGSVDLSLPRALLGLGLLSGLLPIVLFRWTIGAHFRVLPLLIPFLAVSLAVEGFPTPAVIVAANALLCLIARRYGWRLLEHPGASTVQGISPTVH